ncbi:MAG: carboxypeptidase-like regulatory domain-containing protein, partial [Bacteroidota bacterium]
STQKPIPYVTIKLGGRGVITNEEGRFSLMLQNNVQDTDTLSVSCIGYGTLAKPLKAFTENVILLSPKAIELDHVIVSNKNYSAEEIIALMKDNLEKNHPERFSKKKLFFRQSNFGRLTKWDYTLKKSTITAFNKQSIDSVLRAVPKANSYYTEILGDLYGSLDKDEQKLQLIKASELYDKSKELDLEKIEEKFNKIIQENVKTDSYFKIKSGLFGTKFDADELFEEDIDSTDVAAVNEQLEEARKNEADRKTNFAKYRRNVLGGLLENLPTHSGADLNFITKSNKYRFSLQDFTYLGDAAVYVLDFVPKRSADYQGTLYVNADDFAVIRADFENVKSFKNFKLLGVSINGYLWKGKAFYSKQPDGSYALDYLESEKGYAVGIKRPLKIIELNKRVKGRNKQNELSGKIDFAFTNVEKNEIVIFDTETLDSSHFEAFAEKNTILPIYMPDYDPEFWEGHAIIEPNQAIREFTSESAPVE